MPRLRLTLIAMPWASAERPSPALSALAAFVGRELPDVRATVRSEYVEVAQRLPLPYDPIAEFCYQIGEALYASLLYPDRDATISTAFIAWAREHAATAVQGATNDELEQLVLDLRRELDVHARAVAAEVAPTAEVVGLTCAFGQIFASVLVARYIKQLRPECVVILGGSSVSVAVGPSLLEEYPCLDLVVQGEGEHALVAILRALQSGQPIAHPNVLQRGGSAPAAQFDELATLDGLPLPDYSDYAARAERYSIDWALPIEGSRGCWWDRARKTGNPKQTCYFCNLNVQWNGYREKSVSQIVAEVEAQTTTYRIAKVYFVDNILRKAGAAELGYSLAALGRDCELFYEARANLRPIELVAMWEAGLSSTQFGIEALVTSLLKRIGKGTSAIQNLEAMRLLAELEITHSGNLITDFPGSTDDEVAQTVRTIEHAAALYEPLFAVPFFLGRGATVEVLREQFGVHNVRNKEWYRAGLPDDVWRRLQLLDLDFDVQGTRASWTPVRDAIADWRGAFKGLHDKRLVYRDCVDFLVIEDRRGDALRSGTFDGVARELYLECMETQRLSALLRRWQDVDGAYVRAILDAFVEQRLMFNEGDRYLSLAIATSPSRAAKRIRARAAAAAPAVVRLAVVQ